MKKSRFTESQIVAILKEAETGFHVKEVSRKHGISDASYYNWKSKYGGMGVSDIRRMKELQDENRRFKQMYADLSLENRILKEAIKKKALVPTERRELVNFAIEAHGMNESGACRAFGISRTVYRYRPDMTKDEAVIEALQALAERYPRYGFGKMFPILRRQGHRWNHKRVYRVYCAPELNMRRKGKGRLPGRNPEPLSVPVGINECWSADFMSDALWCGRRFRTFNVVDDFNREALAIEVGLDLPTHRVVTVLERVAAWCGYPAKLRLDNGPEMTSVKHAEWAEPKGVQIEFIERFNRTYREEVLDMYVFKTLPGAELSGEYYHCTGLTSITANGPMSR